MRTYAWALLLLPCAVFPGCGGLDGMHSDHSGGRPAPPASPRVRLVEARLTHHPTNEQLGLHYCTDHATHGRGSSGAIVCRVGATPSAEDLQFRWELDIEVTNPNPVPFPLVQALVGFRVFPDAADAANLGAVCLSLCEHDDACPQPADAPACESDEPDVHDAAALGHATEGLLASVALSEERFQDLRVRTISPHGTVHFTLELVLDTEPMLALIEDASAGAIAEALAGHIPAFVIPYAVDATLWVDARGYGRVAASLERTTGEWDLAAP